MQTPASFIALPSADCTRQAERPSEWNRLEVYSRILILFPSTLLMIDGGTAVMWNGLTVGWMRGGRQRAPRLQWGLCFLPPSSGGLPAWIHSSCCRLGGSARRRCIVSTGVWWGDHCGARRHNISGSTFLPQDAFFFRPTAQQLIPTCLPQGAPAVTVQLPKGPFTRIRDPLKPLKYLWLNIRGAKPNTADLLPLKMVNNNTWR